METKKIRIHNCHTHLFTLDHLPTEFFINLYPVAWLIRNKITRTIIIFLANLIPAALIKKWGSMIPRIAAFLSICDNRSQRDVFTRSLQHYYPADTRFVVLPMDYSFMGYGEPKIAIDRQLEELAMIRDEFPDQVIPFVHIDPRHENALEKVRKWVTERHFKGVKIYPPFGYPSDDEMLSPIYDFCENHENGIPVMTHCSGAALRAKDFKRDKLQANAFCSPEHCKNVLSSHPRLRFCLGHFGGDDAWAAYLKKPLLKDRMNRDEPTFSGTENWLHDIVDMLDSELYPNLFVDISYVIIHYQDNINILKVLLENPRIRRSVLFGTDYYMVEIEKFSEKKLSMFLRAQIGEDYYQDIAEINPVRYLFGPSEPPP